MSSLEPVVCVADQCYRAGAQGLLYFFHGGKPERDRKGLKLDIGCAIMEPRLEITFTEGFSRDTGTCFLR